MANFAYIDKNRHNVIFADQAIKKQIGVRYYCPNSKCDAHMYLCSVDGIKSAYFAATKENHPHIDKCSYGYSNSFIANEVDEQSFNFDDVIGSILTDGIFEVGAAKIGSRKVSKGKIGKKRLRTIRSIYYMCKSLPCDAKFNEYTIGQMLVDDRSEYMYPKGVFGARIIEGVLGKHFYDTPKKEIYIKAPIISKKYSFVLKIESDKLFLLIREMAFNNQDEVFIIAGNWEPGGGFNKFQAKINNKKQVKVIKQKKEQ